MSGAAQGGRWDDRLKDIAVAIGGIIGVILFLLLLIFADGVLLLIEMVMAGYAARFLTWLFG